MPRSADPADIARVFSMTKQSGDIAAFAQDEHRRYRLFTDALANVQPEGERELLAIIKRDPDRAMRESALIHHLDTVGYQPMLAADYRSWISSIEDLVSDIDSARIRASEWVLFKEVQEGIEVPQGRILGSSDWLQRKLSDEAASDTVLATLADKGRTKRVRNTSRSRLERTTRRQA